MTTATKDSGIHALSLHTLDGELQPMSDFRGKVLLIVNTASECGYTPQYEGLEALHQRYKDRGVVVIGVPSNDFGGQEPGSAAQIAKFCKARFGVTFLLLEKSKTVGADASPLFKLLSVKGAPQWNFHKYVVGKDGQVRGAFPSSVAPDAKELTAALDEALRG